MCNATQGVYHAAQELDLHREQWFANDLSTCVQTLVGLFRADAWRLLRASDNPDARKVRHRSCVVAVGTADCR